MKGFFTGGADWLLEKKMYKVPKSEDCIQSLFVTLFGGRLA